MGLLDERRSDERRARGHEGRIQNARRVFGPIAKEVNAFQWGKEPVSGITAVYAHGTRPATAPLS